MLTLTLAPDQPDEDGLTFLGLVSRLQRAARPIAAAQADNDPALAGIDHDSAVSAVMDRLVVLGRSGIVRVDPAVYRALGADTGVAVLAADTDSDLQPDVIPPSGDGDGDDSDGPAGSDPDGSGDPGDANDETPADETPATDGPPAVDPGDRERFPNGETLKAFMDENGISRTGLTTRPDLEAAITAHFDTSAPGA